MRRSEITQIIVGPTVVVAVVLLMSGCGEGWRGCWDPSRSGHFRRDGRACGELRPWQSPVPRASQGLRRDAAQPPDPTRAGTESRRGLRGILRERPALDGPRQQGHSSEGAAPRRLDQREVPVVAGSSWPSEDYWPQTGPARSTAPSAYPRRLRCDRVSIDPPDLPDGGLLEGDGDRGRSQPDRRDARRQDNWAIGVRPATIVLSRPCASDAAWRRSGRRR